MPYEVLLERARTGLPLIEESEGRQVQAEVDGDRNPESISSDQITVDDRRRFVAEGYRGELEITPREIVIRRKGFGSFIAHGLKGDKSIRIDQLTAVQYKRAGVTVGYIQFVFPGSGETKAGVFAATGDENTVTFIKGQSEQFDKARLLIEEHMERVRNPAHHNSQSEKTVGARDAHSSDPIAALKQLAELRDAGIISADEFGSKKQELLARL